MTDISNGSFDGGHILRRGVGDVENGISEVLAHWSSNSAKKSTVHGGEEAGLPPLQIAFGAIPKFEGQNLPVKLDTADRDYATYTHLRSTGQTMLADMVALQIFSGTEDCEKRFPALWNEVAREDSPIMARLHAAGLTQVNSLPTYKEGFDGFTTALGLSSYDGKRTFGILQIKDGDYLDSGILAQRTVGRIASDLSKHPQLAPEMLDVVNWAREHVQRNGASFRAKEFLHQVRNFVRDEADSQRLKFIRSLLG